MGNLWKLPLTTLLPTHMNCIICRNDPYLWERWSCFRYTYSAGQLILNVALETIHFRTFFGICHDTVKCRGRINPHWAIITDLQEIANIIVFHSTYHVVPAANKENDTFSMNYEYFENRVPNSLHLKISIDFSENLRVRKVTFLAAEANSPQLCSCSPYFAIFPK